MSKNCEICGRGPQSSFSRSHSMRATKRRQYLNLQKARINNKSQRVCISCLKNILKKEPQRLA